MTAGSSTGTVWIMSLKVKADIIFFYLKEQFDILLKLHLIAFLLGLDEAI